MIRVSVVICAHAEERWEATLAAVASVRNQSLPPAETILVVDHNPVLAARLRSALTDVVVVVNRTLPRGVARGLADLVRGRPAGLGRAGAIVVGLAATTAGYAMGWLRLRVRRRAASSGAPAGLLTHPQLDQLPGARLGRELSASKALLEDRIGGPVLGLAYPFGYLGRR